MATDNQNPARKKVQRESQCEPRSACANQLKSFLYRQTTNFHVRKRRDSGENHAVNWRGKQGKGTHSREGAKSRSWAGPAERGFGGLGLPGPFLAREHFPRVFRLKNNINNFKRSIFIP